MKICLINLYFGTYPKWFSLFLQCCKANPKIVFHLFSDDEITIQHASNINYNFFTLKDFNQLASKKLKMEIKIQDAYKVCDFKPFYGIIFEDYLHEYDFWGYCDIDIIFGNIGDFIDNDILNKYDIISTYRGFLSGPFCLFRNSSEVNQLFKKTQNYGEILTDNTYIGFDENIQRKDIKGFTLKKLIFFFIFIFKEVRLRNNTLLNFPELRYQFQWAFKKKSSINQAPIDMTEVVWKTYNKKETKIFFHELMLSKFYFRRKRKKNWKVTYKNNVLTLNPDSCGIFGYHFRGSVLTDDFVFENLKDNSSFMITENGIFCTDK